MSDTRACSFLLLFSARTYVPLKKGWRCYSENRGRSLWILRETLWVSSWKSVVLQLGSQKGKKHRNNLKSLTHPGTKTTVFFQNCHRSPRVPVQEKHQAHPWILQCTWWVERGCFLDSPLNQNTKPEWLVETGNYRKNGRKSRAWVAKLGCLREVCPKFLNSNWGHRMMSRGIWKSEEEKRKLPSGNVAFRGWLSPEKIWGPFVWAGSSKQRKAVVEPGWFHAQNTDSPSGFH